MANTRWIGKAVAKGSKYLWKGTKAGGKALWKGGKALAVGGGLLSMFRGRPSGEGGSSSNQATASPGTLRARSSSGRGGTPSLKSPSEVTNKLIKESNNRELDTSIAEVEAKEKAHKAEGSLMKQIEDQISNLDKHTLQVGRQYGLNSNLLRAKDTPALGTPKDYLTKGQITQLFEKRYNSEFLTPVLQLLAANNELSGTLNLRLSLLAKQLSVKTRTSTLESKLLGDALRKLKNQSESLNQDYKAKISSQGTETDSDVIINNFGDDLATREVENAKMDSLLDTVASIAGWSTGIAGLLGILASNSQGDVKSGEEVLANPEGGYKHYDAGTEKFASLAGATVGQAPSVAAGAKATKRAIGSRQLAKATQASQKAAEKAAAISASKVSTKAASKKAAERAAAKSLEKASAKAGTKLTTKVTQVVAAKTAAKGAASKIPVVGVIAGIAMAANRIKSGDWAGAGLEVLSPLSSTVGALLTPLTGGASLVAGNAIAMGIDAATLVRDVNLTLGYIDKGNVKGLRKLGFQFGDLVSMAYSDTQSDSTRAIRKALETEYPNVQSIFSEMGDIDLALGVIAGLPDNAKWKKELFSKGMDLQELDKDMWSVDSLDIAKMIRDSQDIQKITPASEGRNPLIDNFYSNYDYFVPNLINSDAIYGANPKAVIGQIALNAKDDPRGRGFYKRFYDEYGDPAKYAETKNKFTWKGTGRSLSRSARQAADWTLDFLGLGEGYSKKYAKGGVIAGPSHAEGGVPLPTFGEVEGGEFVVNKEDTEKNRELLTDINKGVEFGGYAYVNSRDGVKSKVKLPKGMSPTEFYAQSIYEELLYLTNRYRNIDSIARRDANKVAWGTGKSLRSGGTGLGTLTAFRKGNMNITSTQLDYELGEIAEQSTQFDLQNYDGVKRTAAERASERNTLPMPFRPGFINPSGDLELELMDYFMRTYGLTNYQAAGIVANLKSESGLRPGVLNSSSGAMGLAQWLGSRKTKLLQLYKANPNMDPMEVELSHLDWELKNTHKKALAEVKKAKNAREAADAFFGYYEFSVGHEGAVAEMNKHGQDGVASRGIKRRYSSELHNKFTALETLAPTNAPTYELASSMTPNLWTGTPTPTALPSTTAANGGLPQINPSYAFQGGHTFRQGDTTLNTTNNYILQDNPKNAEI